MATSYMRLWAERRKGKATRFPDEASFPITIWPKYTSIGTGNEINVRCILQGCLWDEDSNAVFQRTGEQIINNAGIYIPYHKETTGRQYITPDEWNHKSYDELDGFWTIDPQNWPLVLFAESDHEFDWAATNAANRITIQENNFLKANVNVRRVKDSNVHLYGTSDMWQISMRT